MLLNYVQQKLSFVFYAINLQVFQIAILCLIKGKFQVSAQAEKIDLEETKNMLSVKE